MAFAPKKKPGMDVAIMVGPRRGAPGKDDIGDPGPLEAPAKKPPMMGAPPPDDDAAGDAHEAGETPGYESTEEQGAKLISDIEAAGEKHGLDGSAARSFAADVFSAMAECLRGGGTEAGGDEPGADEGGPEETYGR